MSQNKRTLELVEEDSYQLVAVHCALEAYYLAFLLNKHFDLKLRREKTDLDFKHKELLATYPLYSFFDHINEHEYYLVSNKFKGNTEHLHASGGLFQEETPLTTNLIPEHKNVDFFLKIEDETEKTDTAELVRALNNIPDIITAYPLEKETLKSKNNLIF